MKKDIRIVIAQRGWVFVGEYSRENNYVTLQNAKCIRRWGTEKGLGQLVDGPTGNTILDHTGKVEMHELAVVSTIECNPDKWNLSASA